MGTIGVLPQLVIGDVFPRALGVFFRAAHAGGQVLEAVHVEPPTAIAWRLDAVAPLQLLHPSHHFGFVRTAVVEALGRGGLRVG